MDRKDAEEKVKRYTKKTANNFSYVSHIHASLILGEEKFLKLLQDPIRKLGPLNDTVYPWNVVDYLVKKE